MEKQIKLVMEEDKSIKIFDNGKEVIIISPDNRNISAEKIFKIMQHNKGDRINVEIQNDENVDQQVLVFFASLFSDIAAKINEINNE